MSVRHLVHLKHRNKFKLQKTAVKFYLEIPSEKTRGGEGGGARVDFENY